MRFIFYAAFIVFTCFCVIIAISNSAPVLFSLEPLPVNLQMPAYGLVFLGIFIGLLGGWIVSIYSAVRHARKHRLADKKIKELQNELKKPGPANIDLSKSAIHGKSSSE
ncbi:MAG: LapA family protein [Kordiimonadaceae bacterium]|jgi:hypothetical protein|nr:LapA family protein [Kordiimonadaceae bacterium]MBT6035990.1 LapA family protein [Kordiimonadaceae bacterium]MBT6330629.1 LapA family protein [Kordiimonadaceae bacterium]MBT7582680.1 LapA family protein [Kordiimonadaceae bacterium]